MCARATFAFDLVCIRLCPVFPALKLGAFVVLMSMLLEINTPASLLRCRRLASKHSQLYALLHVNLVNRYISFMKQKFHETKMLQLHFQSGLVDVK